MANSRDLQQLCCLRNTTAKAARYRTCNSMQVQPLGAFQHGDDCDNACALVCAGMLFPQNTGQAAPGQRLVAERRWRLGVHSRGHPHRIIEDLLSALHALSVGYKKLAPYNYKCRKLYPARGEHTAVFRGLTPSAPHLVPLMNFDRAVPVSSWILLQSGRPG